MGDLDDLRDVLDRTIELTKSRLSDLSSYPVIDGKIAFTDEDIMWRYAKARRSRPNEHMIQYSMWDMHMDISGNEVKWQLSNRKNVSGTRSWNLVDDILSVGTSRYESKRYMSFYDRYRNKWSFHRKSRSGIGMHFVSAFNQLVHDAIHQSLADAIMDYKNGRL